MKWVREHRSDLLGSIEAVYAQSEHGQDSFLALMSIGFEAGRQFQHDNPELELNSPSVYLD